MIRFFSGLECRSGLREQVWGLFGRDFFSEEHNWLDQVVLLKPLGMPLSGADEHGPAAYIQLPQPTSF